MKTVIGVKELRDAGLLGVEYTVLDLYDAFMMYVILKSTSVHDHFVLQNEDSVIDTRGCFEMNNWF